MKEQLETIEVRVQRSIQRMGYEHIKVVHLGDGKIALRGIVPTPSDRTLVFSAVRSVVGVTDVSNELKANGRTE